MQPPLFDEAITTPVAPLDIHTLPIELLAHTLSFLPFQDILSATHVCCTWREVALGEPGLWTELSLNGASVIASRHARQLGRYSWPYPSFLDALLLRSRSLPVMLSISGLDKARLLALCQSIPRHMHRIRALRIFNIKPCFIRPHELPASAKSPSDLTIGMTGSQFLSKVLRVPGPVLEELWIHDQGESAVLLTGGFFTFFPRLRSLSLVSWGVGQRLVSPVQSVRYLAVGCRSSQLPMPGLFRQFPGMRELVMTGVGRHLPLPVMDDQDTLHSLSIVPASDDWKFSATRNIAPQRIAHITIQHPSPAVSREFLASLQSIETVRLDRADHSIAGMHLYASTAGQAMSRTLNTLCLRVLGEIFEGWQTMCFANVATVAVSDKLPWASVLPFLSAMRSVRELTFLVSPWTAKAIHRERNYDTIGGPHLFDSDSSAAEVVWPQLPSLRTLRFIAVQPVLLDPQALKDASPDEVTAGGWAAHRVSATLVRTMLSRFECRLDLLAFDGVVIQEGADAPVMPELRELPVVQSLVVTPPGNV